LYFTVVERLKKGWKEEGKGLKGKEWKVELERGAVFILRSENH